MCIKIRSLPPINLLSADSIGFRLTIFLLNGVHTLNYRDKFVVGNASVSNAPRSDNDNIQISWGIYRANFKCHIKSLRKGISMLWKVGTTRALHWDVFVSNRWRGTKRSNARLSRLRQFTTLINRLRNLGRRQD